MNEEVFKAEDLVEEIPEVIKEPEHTNFALDLSEDVKEQLARHDKELKDLSDYCDDMEKRFHDLKELISEKGEIVDLTKSIEGIVDGIYEKFQSSDKVDIGDFIEIIDSNLNKKGMFILEEFLPVEYVEKLNKLVIIKEG